MLYSTIDYIQYSVSLCIEQEGFFITAMQIMMFAMQTISSNVIDL